MLSCNDAQQGTDTTSEEYNGLECSPSTDTLPEDIYQQIVDAPAAGLLKSSNFVPFIRSATGGRRRLASGLDSERSGLPFAMRSSDKNDDGTPKCYLSIDAWYSLAYEGDDITSSSSSTIDRSLSSSNSDQTASASRKNRKLRLKTPDLLRSHTIPRDRRIPADTTDSDRRGLRLAAAASTQGTIGTNTQDRELASVLISPSSVNVETRMMMHLLTTGTLAICLDASTWNTYVSGIYGNYSILRTHTHARIHYIIYTTTAS